MSGEISILATKTMVLFSASPSAATILQEVKKCYKNFPIGNVLDDSRKNIAVITTNVCLLVSLSNSR
jgi:predicted permease